MSNKEYVQRSYRKQFQWGLRYVSIRVRQSELYIGAAQPSREQAFAALKAARKAIEAEIRRLPAFATSLTPLPYDAMATGIVADMYRAGQAASVGPMAAVAGAIAQAVGQELCKGGDIVVENGGDLYLETSESRILAIFAGDSPLSMKVGVEIPPGKWGACTSAGRVGPSLSFGRADAAFVLAHDAALADAAATALGNRSTSPDALQGAVMELCAIPGITGAVSILGETLAAAGDIRLTPAGKEG